MLVLVGIAPAGFLLAEEGEQAVEQVQTQVTEPVEDAGVEVSEEVPAVEENTNKNNQEGADGQAAGISDGDASVETGDAVSQVDLTNTINTNTVDTSAATAADASKDISDTDDTNVSTTTLSVLSENYATSTLFATSTAETGDNSAESNGGTASVSTGDAFASANVVNSVNSNFVGSDGAFQLLNLFGNMFGDVSLSMENGAGCSFLCFLTQLFVQSHNSAYLENNIAVTASTGGNTALSTAGSADISTGNAFAAANVINMVNTNVVGSDYLAFIMNAFGSWEGDLILPPGSFFSAEGGKEKDGCCADGNAAVINTNGLDAENNVAASADTGGNSAESGEESIINTGDAAAVSNIMTIANTNIFGNNLLLLYVRTGGRWSGRIFSLPNGVTIVGTDDGFIIDGFTSRLHSAPTSRGISSISAGNNSIAQIINNVSASARTGNNGAITGGDASISTGNAFSAANVVNIANTNIIGKNWLLAILNIFGDWNGDLAFGRPDVWVGTSAEGPSPLGDGARVTFTITYRNNGNAPATQSGISVNFGENFRVTDPRGGAIDEEKHTITFDAGTIHPGSTGSFTFVAQTRNTSLGESKAIVSAAADMYEDDANFANNADQLFLNMYNKPPEGFLGYHQLFARLEIKKERVGAEIAHPGEEIPYKITLENKGSANAYKVRVTDEMRNGDTVITAQGWDLDTVLPGEKVVIEYTIAFAAETPAGLYTNYALAEWYDEVGNYVDHSGHSSASVEVVPAEISAVSLDMEENSEKIATATQVFVHEENSGSSFVEQSAGYAGEENELAVIAANADTNSESDDISFYHEKDVLTDAHVVYAGDTRPLDRNLRDELNRGFNPWDPQNLLARVSASSAGYSIVWALLASFVVYMVTRRRAV